MVERLALIVRGHRTSPPSMHIDESSILSCKRFYPKSGLSGVYLAGLLVSEMHGVVRVELERDRHLQH